MLNSSESINLLHNLTKKYSENTIEYNKVYQFICDDILLLSKAFGCVCFQEGISSNSKKILAASGEVSTKNLETIINNLSVDAYYHLALNNLIKIDDSEFHSTTFRNVRKTFLLKINNNRPLTYLLLLIEDEHNLYLELVELFSKIVTSGFLNGNLWSNNIAYKYSENLCFYLNPNGELLSFLGNEPEIEKELFPDSLFSGDILTEKINPLYAEDLAGWVLESLKGNQLEREIEIQTNLNSCFLKISCIPEYLNGNLIGNTVIIHNITYTRELERSLNEITQIINSVNQSAIVSITDNNGAITYVNTRFESVSGYSLTELLGRTHNVIESTMHDRVFWRDFWMHISSGKVWRGVIINKRKNDDLYWVDSTISPMFDQTGEIESYISIGFEVTENEMIKKELDKKEILISETHHRIKNNLQIVRSLLSLQRKKYDNKELQKTILDSENRIMAMAMVHESIYHNHNADKLSLKHYLHSFIGELANSYLSTDTVIDLNIEDGYLESSALISLGIIINELVSNTSKYAFDANSKDKKVSLIGERVDSSYRLKYSDNGIGLPEEMDYKTLKSLGINLIMGLGKQMKAKPNIWNDEGFNFEIMIPYKYTK